MDSRIGYDTDFLAWTQEQARLLRDAAQDRPNTPIDWENVAEEIESIGRRERRALQEGIRRIILGLLQLQNDPHAKTDRELRPSIMRERFDVKTLLNDSPSVRGEIDLLDIYRRARLVSCNIFADCGVFEKNLPVGCPYSLEQILDVDWWPTNSGTQEAI